MSLCLIVVFFSCTTKKNPKGEILSNEKMQAVMWDIFQADAYTEFYVKKDSSKNSFLENAALQKKIFSLHKVNKEDFYETYEYYSNRNSDMRILLDSISAKAERQRNKMTQKKYSPTHRVKSVPQR